MERYVKSARYWDKVFAAEEARFPARKETGCAALDRALDWLCEGAQTVLDFGCGNGSLLLLCALRGTREHIGVDLSAEAVRMAEARAALSRTGSFRLLRGGVEALQGLSAASMDAIVLSNILDNLFPCDAREALSQVARVARRGARLLVKLNPYLTAEQMAAWNIRVIEGDLLDDGLPLWNRTTEEWLADTQAFFRLERSEDAFWPQFDRTERLLLLRRK